MKQIILMRHGKSSWRDTSLKDFDRPLAKRGRVDTKAMGKWLAKNMRRPELIVCSSALRCQQTLSNLPKSFTKSGDRLDDEALYHASSDQLLKQIKRLDDTVNFVLLIGHNTGLLDLARRLSQHSKLADGYFGKFPTSAMGLFTVKHANWRAIGTKPTRLCWYMTPKKLKTRAKAI